jgi:hypothetical protein
MTLSPGKIADGFSLARRDSCGDPAAHADEIRYPEFVKRAREAGVAGYEAFLSGKEVLFGRQGEFHVEEFPQAKPSLCEKTRSGSGRELHIS